MAETQRIRGQLGPALSAHKVLADRFGSDNDFRGLTWAVSGVAQILLVAGAPLPASDQFRRAEEYARRIGCEPDIAFALRGQAEASFRLGKYSDAECLADRALRQFREVGFRVGEGYALRTLSHVAAIGGDRDRALVLAEEALALFQRIADPRGMAYMRDSIAAVDPASVPVLPVMPPTQRWRASLPDAMRRRRQR